MPRSDAENLALRAWASSQSRQPVNQLRRLLEAPIARPVFHRMAKSALASGNADEIARVLLLIQAEVDRIAACQALVKQNMPLLLDYLHPGHAIITALATKSHPCL